MDGHMGMDGHKNKDAKVEGDSTAISIEALRKEYESGAETIVVLDSIDLEIANRSLVVVTGESGSGKTTFLNLLAGIDSPSSGRIRVGSWEVGKASESVLSRYRSLSVGLVFQFHYLLKEFTALENVMMPAYMAGVPKKKALAAARELLHEVGLDERADHFPNKLSGGERQRAAVARALINDPPLILADEPTGNLDERNSRMVEELLFSLAASRGKTLVVVTHNSRLARDGTTHLHLAQGKFERSDSDSSPYLHGSGAQ